MVVLWGSLSWRVALLAVPIAAQPLLALVLFAASQALWRAVLNRHYRSSDLAA